MAVKRVAQSSVDWAEFASRIHPSMQSQFTAFKTQSATYAKIVASKQESIRKINFDDYKAAGLDSKLVDSFKTQFDALKVPYPSSKSYIDKLEEVKRADAKEIEEETAKSEERIVDWRKYIDYYEKMPLPSVMHTDELLYYYPTATTNWRIPETFDTRTRDPEQLFPIAPTWVERKPPLSMYFESEIPGWTEHDEYLWALEQEEKKIKQEQDDAIRLAELEKLEAEGKLPDNL